MRPATSRTLVALCITVFPLAAAGAAQDAPRGRRTGGGDGEVALGEAPPGAATPRAAALRAAAIRDVGTGSAGRPWVLLTGVMGGIDGYGRLEARLLGGGARVVVIDPYRLSLDEADVSFTALARRVDAELARLGIADARVVAHAHGAGVALRLAAYAPNRVADLTLLDAGALVIEPSGVLNSSLRIASVLARLPGGRAILRGRLEHGLRENSGRDGWLDSTTRRAYTEPLLADVGRTIGMALRVANAKEAEPVPSVVARVRVPVTVVLGAMPHASGATQEELDFLQPLGARLRVEWLAGVGHFVHEEAPDELMAILRRPRATTVGARAGP